MRLMNYKGWEEWGRNTEMGGKISLIIYFCIVLT